MNFLLRSILATAMLIPLDAVVEEAEAAGAGTCNQYVAATRSLAARAKAAKCDFWGDFNEAASRRWCNGVRESTISEAMPRDATKVQSCEACRQYSDFANAAARDAEGFRCGFSGNRWGIGSGDANDAHFIWCAKMRSTDDFNDKFAVTDEWGARDGELAQCKATWRERFSDKEKTACEKYALDAVEAALFNQKNNCGANPTGRWTLDKEAHLLWCIPRVNKPTERADFDVENSARYDGVEACKKGGKLAADGRPKKDTLISGKDFRKPVDRPIKNFSGGRPTPAKPVKNNVPHGSGGASTASNPMDLLGGGGSNVPNIVPPPKSGSGGPSLAAPSGGNNPGAGSATPTVTAPAVSAAPIKSLGKSGPDGGIDYGGAPRQTGTKIR